MRPYGDKKTRRGSRIRTRTHAFCNCPVCWPVVKNKKSKARKVDRGAYLEALKLEAERKVDACTCGSYGGDAWRCAKRLNLPTISCHCVCHKYIAV